MDSPNLQHSDIAITHFQDGRFYFNKCQILEYLAASHPFDGYGLKSILEAVTTQMRTGCYAVALKDGKIIAYAGWILTTQEVADRWLQHEGQLTVEATAPSAAVFTILAVSQTDLLLPISRYVRRKVDGLPVVWKRHVKGRGLHSRRLVKP
jgi:hypothetical protein